MSITDYFEVINFTTLITLYWFNYNVISCSRCPQCSLSLQLPITGCSCPSHRVHNKINNNNSSNNEW